MRPLVKVGVAASALALLAAAALWLLTRDAMLFVMAAVLAAMMWAGVGVALLVKGGGR